ncbi:YgjV family protein [Azospirillum doebereinerae]
MVFLFHQLTFLSDLYQALSLVTVTGLAGLAFGTLSTLLNDRRAILSVQAAASSLFMLHFLCLGARTGMMMCLLGLVQMAASFPRRRTWRLNALFAATVPAALAVAAVTWQGPMSGLSATGFVLATLGRWQTDVARMRLFFVMATLVGAGHNTLAGSVFGLCSDAMGLSGHGWRLWRAHAGRRRVTAAHPGLVAA